MNPVQKILIVDDRKENLVTLRQVLHAVEAEIIAASSGNEALAATLDHDFALAILDVMMPGMSGFELAEHLRGDDTTRLMPIIFVSAAYPDERHIFTGYAAGGVDYIVKPFASEILLAKVRVFLEMDLQKQELQRHRDQLEELVAERTRALDYELAGRKRVEEVQAFLLQSGLPAAGEDFFASLARYLAETLGVEYVCIDRLEGDGLTAETVGVYNDGKIESNVRYALKDTPCGEVVDQSVCCYPRGVQQLFPRDTALQELKAESYFGTILRSSKGRPIGLIAVIGQQALNEPKWTESLLKLVAPRAAGELERRQAQEEIRESEEKNRKLIQALTDAIIVRSRGVITYANPAAVKLFRANRMHELIGKRYLDLVHPDDRAASVERVRKSAEENWVAPPREHRLIALDGQVVEVESTGLPVQFRGEAQEFGVFRDITERNKADHEKEKLEAQLRQLQKMEAIGTLAGGIAHDFNNILSVIIGNSELLTMTDECPSSLKHGIHQIFTASQRAKQLVNQILSFSRQGAQQKLLINLKTVIKETIEFLRASLPSTIQLQHHIKPEAGVIMADPTQMQQILMNLCTNAAHAMAERGGVLKIDFDNAVVTEEEGRLHPGIEAGNYVRLTVSDTGQGMAPSVQTRIFDPYFTTKEPGKGTGLGLAVVHGIVNSHGGMITVDSAVGKGTTFNVFLPRAEGVETAEPKTAHVLPKGTETILFVDDEAVVADLGKQMLGLLGYQVETRTSSIEALELFRHNPERFDAVVTDMTMPQMTGMHLAREMLAIRPVMPIILCTGFSDQANEAKARSAGIRAFLFKPLAIADLAKELRRVLDEK